MKWTLGVLMIAIAMGWASTATIPAATPTIDDVSLKFLPPDTVAVAFVDVAALRNAPLVQDLAKNKDLQLPYRLAEFIEATGFDPQRDLDKVTFAKINARDGLAVAQGRVDRFKVEQFFKDKGKSSEAYLGQTLFRDGNGAVALIDDVVLAGQVNAVKRAIEQRQLPGSMPLKAELLAALQTIDVGSQVWGVGELALKDMERVGVRGPAPVVDMLKSLRTGTFQMNVDSAIHAKATGNFADAQSAKDVGDLAQGALAIARLQMAKQKPELLPVLNGIQVSASGVTVNVKLEMSGELFKGLMGAE